MRKSQLKMVDQRILTGRGFDVASVRADDLDKACLTHLQTKTDAKVLDVGCGQGGQSLRMAMTGAKVTAIDSHDFSAEFASLRTKYGLSKEQLDFKQGDITELVLELAPNMFSDAVCQRVLHYLPYQNAVPVLKHLYDLVQDKLFISVSGMDSAIGVAYVQRERPVEERFCVLDTHSAKTFFITQPICLYTEKDFLNLLKVSGWQVQENWQSAFGNLKAICSH